MKLMHRCSHHAFTLIEVVLASLAAALIMAAIYGVFQQAIAIRNSDTDRTRDSRMRLRAANAIRDDLRNALISGGTFAGLVAGSTEGTYQGSGNGSGAGSSSYPGYLEFTTTTGKDTPNSLYGDVQLVAYYIASGTMAGATGTSGASITGMNGGGSLVRLVTRDLLDTQPQPQEEQILPDVTSMQVAFYDGTNWQTSWNYNTADSGTGSSTSGSSSSVSTSGGAAETLPLAIRVDIEQAPRTAAASPPPAIEVLVPWTTQPFTSPTPSTTGTP